VAQATTLITTPCFRNLSDAALADTLGHADAALKGAEAECKALKDEIKRRGLSIATGDEFTVAVTEQIAGRLDTKATRNTWASPFTGSRSRSSQSSFGSRPPLGSRQLARRLVYLGRFHPPPYFHSFSSDKASSRNKN
jgi:hypothetical protein